MNWEKVEKILIFCLFLFNATDGAVNQQSCECTLKAREAIRNGEGRVFVVKRRNVFAASLSNAHAYSFHYIGEGHYSDEFLYLLFLKKKIKHKMCKYIKKNFSPKFLL